MSEVTDNTASIEAADAYIHYAVDGTGRGTGYRPELQPDPRDFRASQLFGSAAPPQQASLREFVPSVRDQGQQGACTGFSMAYAVETLVRKLTHWETRYSPQWFYNLARESINELHLDHGAYLRDVVQTAKKIGASRESDFPYYEIQDIQHKRPPEKAFESARSWQLGGYYKCHSLHDVKRSIAAGYPVVFGFLCYPNLREASATGRIPEPVGSPTGGHAVMAAEYNDSTRYVSGPNSWSRAWGDNGWYYLPYSFFESGKCADIWALVDESAATQWPLKAD